MNVMVFCCRVSEGITNVISVMKFHLKIELLDMLLFLCLCLLQIFYNELLSLECLPSIHLLRLGRASKLH